VLVRVGKSQYNLASLAAARFRVPCARTEGHTIETRRNALKGRTLDILDDPGRAPEVEDCSSAAARPESQRHAISILSRMARLGGVTTAVACAASQVPRPRSLPSTDIEAGLSAAWMCSSYERAGNWP